MNKKGALNASLSIPSDCMSAFNAQALNQTNFYRLKHKVAALASNASITNIAQPYSANMCDTFKFAHNGNRGSLGENIYMQMYSAPFSLTAASCAGTKL